MTASARMGDDSDHLTERILNLTLEIIHLLTGEGYKVVKEKSGEPPTPNDPPDEPAPVAETPPPSLRAEINNKKIIEIINKIVDLLTEETESLDDFNIIVKEEDDNDDTDDDDDDDMGEEWVYIGYKSHFKNFMMEKEPPLASPDGSSKCNSPERCPRPLYSEDSSEEDLDVPYCDECEKDTDAQTEVTEEAETPVRDDVQPVEEDEIMAALKEKLSSLSITSDGSSKRDPPKRCPCPLCSWDTRLDDHNYAIPYQCENDIEMNYEEELTQMGDYRVSQKEDGMTVTMKEKETSSSITPDHGHDVPNTISKLRTSYEDTKTKDNGMSQHSSGVDSSTQPLHPAVPEKASVDNPKSDKHKTKKIFSCSKCQKSFTRQSFHAERTRKNTRQRPIEEREKDMEVQTEVTEEEETPMRGGQQSVKEDGMMATMKEKETSIITPDHGDDVPITISTSYEDTNGKDKDPNQRSPEVHTSTQPLHPNVHDKASIDNPKSDEDKHKKIFPCSECEKSFTSQSCYAEHTKTHTGQRPIEENEKDMEVQPEVTEEEETPVRGGQQSMKKVGMMATMKEKETSVSITPDHGDDVPNTISKLRTSYEDNNTKDKDPNQHSPEVETSTQPLHPAVPEKASVDNPKSDEDKTKKIFPCSKCQKSFTSQSCYAQHTKTHTGQRPIEECEKNMEVQTEVTEEEETPMRGGQQSMKKVGMMATMKEKETSVSITPEHGHDVPNTRSRSRTSHEDTKTKQNGTTRHSPRVHTSTQPLHPAVPGKRSVDNPKSDKHKTKKIFPCSECEKSFTSQSCYAQHTKTHTGQRPIEECEKDMEVQTEVTKEEETPMRGGQQAMKEGGMMATVKEKETSVSITPEHGHDVPNTRSRSRTSHEDSKTKENGTTRHSPRVHTSTQPLHPAVPGKRSIDNPKSDKHKTKKNFPCSECEKSFTSQSCYAQHTKTHPGQRPIEECEKDTEVQTEVTEEEETPMRGGQQSVKKVGMMATMKEKETSSNISPEPGDDVPNTRSRRRTSSQDKNTKDNGTTRHSPRVHTSTQPLHPAVPGQASVDNPKSDKHKTKKNFPCSECEKSFTSQSCYAQHTKTHTRQRPIEEREKDTEVQTEVTKEEETPVRGGQQSVKKVGMMATMKEKETSSNITPEPGDDVPNTRSRRRTSSQDKTTKDNGTTRHSPRVHTATQPLHPAVPGKASVDNPKCDKHKKIFPCSECEKSFTSQSCYAQHTKTHTGQRPIEEREKDTEVQTEVTEAEETPMRGGQQSVKKVGMMATMKEKETSSNISPDPGHDVPNTRSRRRTSYDGNNTKDNGTSQRSPGVHTSTQPLHLAVPEKASIDNPKSVKHKKIFPCSECEKSFTSQSCYAQHTKTHIGQRPIDECEKDMEVQTEVKRKEMSPMRGGQQSMKNVRMMTRIKEKKTSLTITPVCFPEPGHDVPNTRSRLRTPYPDHNRKGNGTAQCSPKVDASTQTLHPTVPETKEEVTPTRGGQQSLREVGMMATMKVNQNITPARGHDVPNTRSRRRSSYPDHNTQNNGTDQLSPGGDSSTQPLHPAPPEQFLSLNKMIFSCSECGKSFTKRLYFAIHKRMHSVRRQFQEDHTIPHYDQSENDMEDQTEVKKEEMSPLRGGQQSMKKVGIMASMKAKRTSLSISPARGHDVPNTRSRRRTSYAGYNSENKGSAQCSPRVGSSTQPLRPAVHKKLSVDNRRSVKHKTKKVFPCSECGKSFTKESYFAMHSRTHTGNRPFVCVKCGKGFTYNSCLLRHQRHHTEVRPHPCSHCGKCFKERSALRQHLRSHTGERPFPCPQCGQRFSQNEHLQRHLRAHTGETPFACRQCGKSFSRKDMLALHEQRHVEERPFSCLQCGSRFTNPFCLVRHQKLHDKKRS